MCHIAHVTASSQRWMSHGTHVWMRHVTYEQVECEWVVAHICMCLTTLQVVTRECVMSHMWLRLCLVAHVTVSEMNESRHTSRHTAILHIQRWMCRNARATNSECVITHMWLRQRWMSHGTHHDTCDCVRDEWVMAHIMTHVTRSSLTVSYRTCDCVRDEWVTAHIMTHVTAWEMNESWHTSWHTAIWLIPLWMCHIAHVTASRQRWMGHGTPAQEWTDRTPISHERTSVHSLVLPGSQSSFTEITEYTYVSLI